VSPAHVTASLPTRVPTPESGEMSFVARGLFERFAGSRNVDGEGSHADLQWNGCANESLSG